MTNLISDIKKEKTTENKVISELLTGLDKMPADLIFNLIYWFKE